MRILYPHYARQSMGMNKESKPIERIQHLAPLREVAFHCFQRPPQLSVSEWAESNLYLSPEDSAEPGRYLTNRAPYQKGILDAFTEEGVEEVTVMSSAQVGKTLILKALIGYYIDLDPSPLLIVQPTIEMGESFSKDRLAPMIRDSPALAGKIQDPKSRNSSNTILKKHFPGGHLVIAGANSPASLSSRPIRVLLCDEVDRYPTSAGSEGDPVTLAKKRTATYRARKKIALVSTPTVKGHSRIERAWELSDKRLYFVPCPTCDHRYTLEWERIFIDDNNPAKTFLTCPACGALITESERFAMLSSGEWRVTNPAGSNPGFHLNELYSPWRKLSEIASDYLRSLGNPEEERAWWNTAMGLPFESIGDRADPDQLSLHRENYTSELLPAGIIVITAGIDTQKDRIELELVGWGIGEESWGIEAISINSSPGEPETWQRLDELLGTLRFNIEDGRSLRVLAACIDSGGHFVQQVYEFATPKANRCIWAVKGQFGPRPVWPKRHSRSNKYRGHVLRMVGTDTAKDSIYAYWHTPVGKPGYCHFAINYPDSWFEQATAEKRVTKIDMRGNEYRIWEKPAGVRNEALDCRVYAYAALQGLKIERRLILAGVAKQMVEAGDIIASKPVRSFERKQPEPMIRDLPKSVPPKSTLRSTNQRRVMSSRYLRTRN